MKYIEKEQGKHAHTHTSQVCNIIIFRKICKFVTCRQGHHCVSFTKRSQIFAPNAHVALAVVKQLILRPTDHENGSEMYKN